MTETILLWKKDEIIFDLIDVNQIQFEKTLFYYGKDRERLSETMVEREIAFLKENNCLYMFFKLDGKIIELLKKEFNLPIVCGGPHVSCFPEKIIKETGIDVAVIGEGEHTILEIAEAIKNGDGFENIKGIVYKNKDSKIIVTEKRLPVLS